MEIPCSNQAKFHSMSVRKFRTQSDMSPVGSKLKELRLRAKPSLSIRKIADELQIPHASYQFYERDDGYKKPFLPIEFARRLAGILASRGVDPSDVMALAGLKDAEAEPDVREIEAARSQVYFASLPVALPSENALADMFESLLALIPAEATRTEAARILAQRLPSGFAAIGPVVLDLGMRHGSASATAPQSPAIDHHEPEQPSRT
ncbi:helix-turn-helix transcriptional regulator [Sphingobium sp.]|uniref:helix-turn-helix transcriptional regulator n=1 Tax=Sphingobium sp. TaxID=1912891 RepID=UPI001A34371E|nr:helix-turn-helix transcriptional regulator [Sphingobium sp.]MBJ7376418.1 helix-turn-helix transcriptional regulator [Sphingobium sp.]